jgi:hypothetical protein
MMMAELMKKQGGIRPTLFYVPRQCEYSISSISEAKAHRLNFGDILQAIRLDFRECFG